MRGSTVKRGRSWSFVVDMGEQPARMCAAGCRAGGGRGKGRSVVVWPEDKRKDCPRCGGELRAAVKTRRQRWQGGFPTKKAADEALREALGVIKKGGDPFPENLKFADYIPRWLDSRTAIRPTTKKRYEQMLDADLTPVLGTLELSRIRPAHIADALDKMRKRGLSPATITQARAVLSVCFRQAVKWELVQTSPVAAVERPHVPRADLTVPTAADLRRLLDVAAGDAFEIPVYLVVGSGARRGEALGCRWSDLDLATGRLRIERAIQRLPMPDGTKGLQLVEPKTQKSRRQVTLPPFVIERLKRWKVEQATVRLSVGEGWQSGGLGDLIVTNAAGRPLTPDGFSQAWKRLCKRAGLSERIRLHDGRHAFATTLLEQGVPLVVASAALGHSSVAVTGNVYSHVRQAMSDAAGAALQAAWEAAE